MDDTRRDPLEEATDVAAADAESVAAALAGDLRAFDRLIEGHQRRAVAVAYRLLGNINDAMDVCQEAYVRAFKSLASLDEPRKFGGWLLRIVSNLSLNFRRDRRPMLSLSGGDQDASVDENFAADRGAANVERPSQSMESEETQRAVSAAIDALPDKQRLALVLFAIEGLPQKEVAEIMECSVELVKWNVFQARKSLKETLRDYME